MNFKSQEINNWDKLPIILDLKTVSVIFNVSELTIRRWLAKNYITGTKIGNKWLFDKNYIKSIFKNNKID